MIEGGCRCGAIRYHVDAEPVTVRQCWCRDCQRISGGNATVNMIVRRASLHVSGAPACFESRAESGNHMYRWFCPHCGAPLFSESLENKEFRGIRVGSLDDPGRFAPQAIIWTDSAPAWAHFDPALPAFPRQVPITPTPVDTI